MEKYKIKNKLKFCELYKELEKLNYGDDYDYKDNKFKHDIDEDFDSKGDIKNEHKFCSFFLLIYSEKYSTEYYSYKKNTYFKSLIETDTNFTIDELEQFQKYLELFEIFLLIVYTLAGEDYHKQKLKSKNFFINEFNISQYHYKTFKDTCQKLCKTTARCVSELKNLMKTIQPDYTKLDKLTIYFRKFSLIFSNCDFYKIDSYNLGNNLMVIMESLIHINYFENCVRMDQTKIEEEKNKCTTPKKEESKSTYIFLENNDILGFDIASAQKVSLDSARKAVQKRKREEREEGEVTEGEVTDEEEGEKVLRNLDITRFDASVSSSSISDGLSSKKLIKKSPHLKNQSSKRKSRRKSRMKSKRKSRRKSRMKSKRKSRRKKKSRMKSKKKSRRRKY